MNSYVCIIHQRLNRSQGKERVREGGGRKEGTERKKEEREEVRSEGWRQEKRQGRDGSDSPVGECLLHRFLTG